MKKMFLLYFAAIIALFPIVFSSCKKVVHQTSPTPANTRLASYHETFTAIRYGMLKTITDHYTFFYDGQQRLSKIFYTTNDSPTVDKSMVFTYVGDTIFKRVTALKTTILLEIDTFVKNPQGQIVSAYFPGSYYNFSYLGKLLTQQTQVYRDSNNSISATTMYTSDNMDLLSQTFDGTLHAKFTDSGYRTVYFAPDNDTILSLPLNITWTVFGATTSITTRTINAYQDDLTGYTSGDPVSLSGVDNNGVTTFGTFYFPGGVWPTENYDIHYNKANAVGDYLQLRSFTTYGVNLYQNQHLIWKIRNAGRKTEVNYTIDATSKITQTMAVITDSITNRVFTDQFNLQYETY
jgi:hypothetical protein